MQSLNKLFRQYYKIAVPTVIIIIAIIIGAVVLASHHKPKTVALSSSSLPNVSRKVNQDLHGYTTAAFTVTSDHWGFNWSYDCAGAGNIAPVDISVQDSSGSPDDSNLGAVIVPDTSKHLKDSGTEQESKAGTYKIWAGTACAWHVQVLNNIGSNSTSIKLTPEEQNNLAAAQSDAQQAGQDSSPTTTPPAPQPAVLLDVSGNGNQQTQPFTTTGNWTLTYTYDCSSFGQPGNFQFNINNTDGSSNTDTGANDLALNGGTTDYYYDAGQHYLSINSECSWHVTVKG